MGIVINLMQYRLDKLPVVNANEQWATAMTRYNEANANAALLMWKFWFRPFS